jgi:hypothetical protein
VATLDDDVSVKQQIAQNLGLIYKALLGDSVLNLVPVPATSTSAGTAGQVAADASFLYVAIGTNLWRRVALSAF